MRVWLIGVAEVEEDEDIEVDTEAEAGVAFCVRELIDDESFCEDRIIGGFVIVTGGEGEKIRFLLFFCGDEP